MELDLRSNGEIPVEYCKYMSSIEHITIQEYNDYTTKIIDLNSLEGMGWFNRISCRNTHLSSILDNFFKIKLLQHILLSDNLIKVVKVDSEAMHTVVKRVINSMGHNIRVVMIGGKKYRFLNVTNLLKSMSVK